MTQSSANHCLASLRSASSIELTTEILVESVNTASVVWLHPLHSSFTSVCQGRTCPSERRVRPPPRTSGKDKSRGHSQGPLPRASPKASFSSFLQPRAYHVGLWDFSWMEEGNTSKHHLSLASGSRDGLVSSKCHLLPLASLSGDGSVSMAMGETGVSLPCTLRGPRQPFPL